MNEDDHVLMNAEEAARYLRISMFTLSKIEDLFLLFPFRTPGGHRRYSQAMLDEYLRLSQLGVRAMELVTTLHRKDDLLVNFFVDPTAEALKTAEALIREGFAKRKGDTLYLTYGDTHYARTMK